MRASSASFGRGSKNQKFSLHFLFLGGGCGGSRQKIERKFLVLLRRFSLRKEQSYFNIFVCSFLHPHGDRGALLSEFGGSSNLREPHTSAFAQPARFARAGCFGVVCVRSVTLYLFCISSRTNPFLIVLENYVVF